MVGMIQRTVGGKRSAGWDDGLFAGLDVAFDCRIGNGVTNGTCNLDESHQRMLD